jgi:predicted hotdog family 3-hydroxylacyl-ACP dehydratase
METGDARIDKAAIRKLIPHSDAMCLLDCVVNWDDQSILCTTDTHRDPSNPLRREERLSAIHAFEYGAQAVAVHGGLRARAAGAVAPPGYLAALRDAILQVNRLDNLPSPLEVRAQRLFGDSANSVYQCHLTCAGTPVAQARVTIILRGQADS